MTAAPAREDTLDSVDTVGYAQAVLNILEDADADRDRLNDTRRAVLNILEDFGDEKDLLESTHHAVLNILDDLAEEREKLDVVNSDLRSEIAERNRVEEVLRVRTQDLEKSNTDLEQFAYVASHDLQEPLRHISAFVQKLAERYGDVVDERGQRYIGYVVEGATRMQRLIDGLLEFSRVGRTQPDLVPIELGTVVAAAELAVSVRGEEANASIVVAELPWVLGDDELLFRLFVNLLSNAIKFARPDCPPRIEIRAESVAGGWWEVVVNDNGIGIEAPYRERAFEIFERLNGHDYSGTGIGLSVARRIVDFHRGLISLDESPGGGTAVRFTLPACPDRSGVNP